ncbi:hypothetical protein CC86DRAFT_164000 [Ophiobolus disseminans]|uniref:Uncharacterized protein n=1 Tax=Ophiobolus disseminans TaxID=1469910 RepID=A0A6A7ABC2_9PLEO|nr:hypothetical protein CC86DRAFT_164000 [Ophiobolus disseminans]
MALVMRLGMLVVEIVFRYDSLMRMLVNRVIRWFATMFFSMGGVTVDVGLAFPCGWEGTWRLQRNRIHCSGMRTASPMPGSRRGEAWIPCLSGGMRPVLGLYMASSFGEVVVPPIFLTSPLRSFAVSTPISPLVSSVLSFFARS